MRDVERQLEGVTQQSRTTLEDLIGRTKRILLQNQKDRNELYALHAPSSFNQLGIFTSTKGIIHPTAPPQQNLQETTHNLPGSCKCINHFPLQSLVAQGTSSSSGPTN
ncbi:hypothetical protein OKW28_000328 [Paraburkholderia sp. 40]